MQYKAIDGRVLDGTVWAPGPLPQTIWVLDPTAAAGARVVRPMCSVPKCTVAKHTSEHEWAHEEVEYEVPRPPGTPMAADLVEAAYEALHRNWRTSTEILHEWYGRTYLATEADYHIERPTPEALTAARAVLEICKRNWQAILIFRHGHNDTVSIGIERVKKFWEEDQMYCDHLFGGMTETEVSEMLDDEPVLHATAS